MKKTLLLLVVLLAGATAWAENYISDVMVIGGSKSEVNNLKTTYVNQGWVVIDKDLNDGCGSSSDYIFLLYKQASDATLGANYVTDFVIISAPGEAPDSIMHQNRKYKLVKYAGAEGSSFEQSKGDLNCHAGGDYIHLYYTTTEFDDRYTAVKSITFNNTQEGGVNDINFETGYDLNTGAGGNYIYMHTDKAEGWTVAFFVNGAECRITGYEGPKLPFSSITIPYSLDNALVTFITSGVFTGFTNLESINFYDNSAIEWMPSMKNCAKLKHVNIIQDEEINFFQDGVIVPDITPATMVKIPAQCFVGTAVEKITLDKIQEIEYSAFEGCTKLSEVNMNSTATIGNRAFANISQRCRINYSGPSSDWDPMAIQLSPNLVVWASGDMTFMGWCGATSATSHNTLYWTMDSNKHLKINSADLMWEDYPRQQLITNKGWTTRDSTTAVKDVKQLTLEHVDTIAQFEFYEYKSLKVVDIKSGTRIIGNYAFESCDSISKVWLPSSISKIPRYAFRNCSSLADIFYDGTQTQWDDVDKAQGWDAYFSEGFKEHLHCTVTFDANGHGTAPEPQYIEWSNQDKAQEPTAPTETGYTFIGWFTDTNLYTQWNFSRDIVPGDMILYAKWMKRGDINADGKVDVSDVNIIINLMLGKAQVNAFPGTADLNNDNKIDVSDVNIVINIMLGKE